MEDFKKLILNAINESKEGYQNWPGEKKRKFFSTPETSADTKAWRAKKMAERAEKEKSLNESELADNEVRHYIDQAKDNLKLHPNDIAGLRTASRLARKVAQHDEGSKEYAHAHDALTTHLINWTESQPEHNHVVAPIQNETRSMFNTAKKNIKTWDEPHVDYNMTAMHLGDAADHLTLAHHVANNDGKAFRDHLRNMDTSPREDIPRDVWKKHGWDENGRPNS